MSQHIFINISSININVYSVVLKFLHTNRQPLLPLVLNIRKGKKREKKREKKKRKRGGGESHLKILAPEVQHEASSILTTSKYQASLYDLGKLAPGICASLAESYMYVMRSITLKPKRHINISALVHLRTLTRAFCRTLHRYSILMSRD